MSSESPAKRQKTSSSGTLAAERATLVAAATAAPRHVIIDCDPGIDDMMALFLALSSPELVVDAITIGIGNSKNLTLMAQNACLALQLCGRTSTTSSSSASPSSTASSPSTAHVPVYIGVDTPLDRRGWVGESGALVHGDDGVGNLSGIDGSDDEKMPIKRADIDLSPLVTDESAVDFIIRHCTEHSGDITVITLGPLCNLATALRKCPDLTQHVRNVVAMGGAVDTRGNKTPCAEANVSNDPTASRVVVTANWSDDGKKTAAAAAAAPAASGQSGECAGGGVGTLTMVPINVTRQVIMDDAFNTALRACGTVGRFCADMCVHYHSCYRRWNTPTTPIHDGTAVMAVIAPYLFPNHSRVYLDVEDEGRLTAGQLVADWKGHWGSRQPHELSTVLLEVDAAAVKALYLERIASIPDIVSNKK